jgi:hypothetical protein
MARVRTSSADRHPITVELSQSTRHLDGLMNGLQDGLGELFADGGAGRSLGGPLPEGRLVWPAQEQGGARPEGLGHRLRDRMLAAAPGRRQRQPTRPAYWLSDAPVDAELWQRLRGEHTSSGLWPVLVDSLRGQPDRPWDVGEVIPRPIADVDDHDAATFMSTHWVAQGEVEPELLEALAPYGPDCPGLAAPGRRGLDPGERADRWVGSSLSAHIDKLGEYLERPARLLLAPAARSADVITSIGWQGSVNTMAPVAAMSAMLRSWEDRFGVRVVMLGFDTMMLTVAAPPTTREHALQVAAEHWAFCSDSIETYPGALAAYAEELVDAGDWWFWWD